MTSRNGGGRKRPGSPGVNSCGGDSRVEKARLVATPSPLRQVIRDFSNADFMTIHKIHIANGLDDRCFPNLSDPLFIVKQILEYNGKIAMASFLKGTCEVFFMIDHTQGTPEQRWEWLQEFCLHMREKAWELGLEEMTAWIPPEIEASFAKRLTELGFVRSPWSSWTLTL